MADIIPEESSHSQGSLLWVDGAEAGQKLLQFLQRRLGLPANLLHRWIRTGQIRVNGKRFKPFNRILEKDAVRLPPFALGLIDASASEDSFPDTPEDLATRLRLRCGLNLIGISGKIWAIEKPAGLPVHPGSNHTDSVSSRLKTCFANSHYPPAPVHRLDRDTGGVLLIASTFQAANQIQKQSKYIQKEYLAKVYGVIRQDRLLRHYLRKEWRDGQEKIFVYDKYVPDSLEALTLVRSVEIGKNESVVQLKLLTGRTHQIRAQLAHIGCPIAGDVKYGLADPGQLMLHAFRVILPEGSEFLSIPAWMTKPAPTPIQS